MRGETTNELVLKRGVETLHDFIGVKLHFNEPDYLFRPGVSKLRINDGSLLKRGDSRFFLDIGTKYSRPELTERLVTLFKDDNRAWIGDMTSEEFSEKHGRRMAKRAGLTHFFRTDIGNIISWMWEQRLGLKKAFTSEVGEPKIVSNVEGGVTEETLCLLHQVFGFMDKPSFDPLWERTRFRLNKYSHWVNMDRKILLEQCDRLIRETAGIG